MKPLKRNIGSLSYSSASSVSTLQLPRNYAYRKLMCRIAGTNTVVGGTGAGAVHTYAAYRAISKIEIVANGRDTIWSIAPEAIAIMNAIDYGTVPSFLNPTNDAAAAYSFNAFFVIDLALIRSVRPIDTLFPSGALSTFDLKVTWGAGSDMFTGAVDFTSATISATTLTVQAFEEIGVIPGGVGVNKLFTIDNVITAANSNYQIRIPVGNVFRGFLIHTKIDQVPADTILDGVTLQSGTEVFQSWQSNDELLDENKLKYSLETRLVGYHMVDFLDSDGFMSEALDARNLSTLDMICNVALPAGTTRSLVVYPQEVILPVSK